MLKLNNIENHNWNLTRGQKVVAKVRRHGEFGIYYSWIATTRFTKRVLTGYSTGLMDSVLDATKAANSFF